MGILLIFLPDIIRVVTGNFQINIGLMPSLCINTHPSILCLYNPLPLSCSFLILAVFSFSISLTFTFPFSLHSPSPLQVHVCPDAKPCPGEHQYHRYSWNPVRGETEDKQRSAWFVNAHAVTFSYLATPCLLQMWSPQNKLAGINKLKKGGP